MLIEDRTNALINLLTANGAILKRDRMITDVDRYITLDYHHCTCSISSSIIENVISLTISKDHLKTISFDYGEVIVDTKIDASYSINIQSAILCYDDPDLHNIFDEMGEYKLLMQIFHEYTSH